MKFGVSTGNLGSMGSEPGPGACLEIARHAEDLGYDSVWVHDHVVLPQVFNTDYPYNVGGNFPFAWDSNVYDPLVMMNALAAVTSRVSIISSVLVIPYRHPALTAKMLANADLLSNGRIILGAGAGWLEDEFDALGLPPEHFRRRGTVTSEYIRAIKEMWTNTGPSNFVGRYVGFIDAGTFPKPHRKPHPPIYLGGKGRNAALRAVRLGDGFICINVTPSQLAEEVSLLRELCRRDKRDPSEIEICTSGRTVLTEAPVDGDDRPPLTGSPDQVINDLREYAKVGLQHIQCTPSVAGEPDPGKALAEGMELFAREILPLFKQ